MSTDEPREIDTTDAEDAQILLADSDDYHRTQRLKEIHRARRNVAQKVEELDLSGNTIGSISYNSIQALAHATAMYVNEILPLVEQADIPQEDTTLPDAHPHDTLHDYTLHMGMKQDSKPAGPAHIMVVYRLCNRILADLKPLITEDETDEWEV